MKRILFLAIEDSSRSKYLIELIDSNYQLDICYHLDEAVTKLDEGFEKYCALTYPSKKSPHRYCG